MRFIEIFLHILLILSLDDTVIWWLLGADHSFLWPCRAAAGIRSSPFPGQAFWWIR
jgi:hypothetical protein